jgi:hypothetical protein
MIFVYFNNYISNFITIVNKVTFLGKATARFTVESVLFSVSACDLLVNPKNSEFKHNGWASHD